jgi:hypothetical protein
MKAWKVLILARNAILTKDRQAFWAEHKIRPMPFITTYQLLPMMALPVNACITRMRLRD